MILKCGCANMFDMKRQLIPRYAYLPIVVCIVWNTLVYNMTRFFTNKMPHYDFSIKLDSYIPFVSSFVVIYILSYVLWIIGFLVFAKESRSLCNELFAAEFVCKTICLFCFVIIPTTMTRANVPSGGVLNWLTNAVYSLDQPNNLFPSIHCMESWICFRGALRCKKVHPMYSKVWFVLAILICMSTVFVKQHVFVDIIGGIVVAEIGLFLSKKFNLGRAYDVVRHKFITLVRFKKKTNKVVMKK